MACLLLLAVPALAEAYRADVVPWNPEACVWTNASFGTFTLANPGAKYFECAKWRDDAELLFACCFNEAVRRKDAELRAKDGENTEEKIRELFAVRQGGPRPVNLLPPTLRPCGELDKILEPEVHAALCGGY